MERSEVMTEVKAITLATVVSLLNKIIKILTLLFEGSWHTGTTQ